MARFTFLENQLLFVRALRQAGLAVAMTQTLDYLRALEIIDLDRRDHLFYTARSFLASRYQDLPLFEAVFELFWDSSKRGHIPRISRQPRHQALQNSGQPFSIVSYRDFMSEHYGEELEVKSRTETFSPQESLQSRRFGDLSSEELDAVRQQILSMRWRVSDRPTRRFVADRSGSRLHLRAILRDAAKHGGSPARLRYLSRKIKPRPTIILADVSGSMEQYSRLLLLFMHCMLRGLPSIEAFVFGTRLTRLTPQLEVRNVDRAIAEAARKVIDWSGGTRIGDSLALFNRRWSRRVLRRGALVIVVSDGWERGDTSILRREMRFLQHRCFRLIWLNPHLGTRGYAPRVEGMAAALPFIDDHLPIGNLRDLEDLSRHLESLTSKRSARRQTFDSKYDVSELTKREG